MYNTVKHDYTVEVMGNEMKARSDAEDLAIAAFRLPESLRDEAREKCEREDMTFSQLMRKAIRKELGMENAGEVQKG